MIVTTSQTDIMKEEYVTFDIETPIYVGDDLSHKKAVNGTLFFWTPNSSSYTTQGIIFL